MKVCCHCKIEKPFNDFGKNKSTKDGYQKQCKSCRRLTQIKYRNESSGKLISKRYQQSDKGKKIYRKATKKYRKTDKFVKSVRKLYKKNRLSNIVSTRMRQSLKGCKYNRHWEDLVGYNLKELKIHLESQFKDGMTWDNHSRNGWHIDHIKPIDSFNITSYDCEDFKKCWSLDNLQPLWAIENIRKGNKINGQV
jgi:hypothetical protein